MKKPTGKQRNQPDPKARRKKGKTTKRKTGKKMQTRPTEKRHRKKTAKRGQTRPDRQKAHHSERVHKVLARAGLGSRRQLEARIAAGEIRIDGQTAQPGSQVGAGNLIEIDGRRWRVEIDRPAHRTLIYNKPEGEVTTRSDPDNRPTVFDQLPQPGHGRWIAVGRLDINTTGLLLLTTDGELAHRMMHPSGKVDREYVCRIRGTVEPERLDQLLEGIELDDGPARFSDIVPGEITSGHQWFTVAIMEGRRREVRRLWEAVGATVARLKRVRFGPVFLPSRLGPGHFEELSAADHRILREDVGLSPVAEELMLEPAD